MWAAIYDYFRFARWIFELINILYGAFAQFCYHLCSVSLLSSSRLALFHYETSAFVHRSYKSPGFNSFVPCGDRLEMWELNYYRNSFNRPVDSLESFINSNACQILFSCLHELLQYEWKRSSPQVCLHALDMLHIPAFLAVYSSPRIGTSSSSASLSPTKESCRFFSVCFAWRKHYCLKGRYSGLTALKNQFTSCTQ